MSLLAAVNQPNGNLDASGNPQYYFAVDRSPVDPTVTAPAFTATGTAGSGGSFTALADSGPAGVDIFNMVSKTANPNQLQWSMGMAVAPSGGNAGNNFAIYSYDDNGAFLSAPIQIVRSTGGVIMQNGMTTTTMVASGAAAVNSLNVTVDADISGDVNVSGDVVATAGAFGSVGPFALRDTMLVRGSQPYVAYTTPNAGGFALDADAGVFNVMLGLFNPTGLSQTMGLECDAAEIAALPVGTTFNFALQAGSAPIQLFVNAGGSFQSLGTFTAPAAAPPLSAPVVYRTLRKVALSAGLQSDWAKEYSAGAW